MRKENFPTCGRVWLVLLALVCLLGISTGIAVLTAKSFRVEHTPSKPEIERLAEVAVTERNPDPVVDWKTFTESVEASCKGIGSGCSMDYQALHRYEEHTFGILIIAWKDSEYEINLFRHHPKTHGWEECPKKEGEVMAQVDIAAVSKKWNVPEWMIRRWLKDAEQAMKNKHQMQGD